MELTKHHRRALVNDLINNIAEKESLQNVDLLREKKDELDTRQQAWRDLNFWKNAQQREFIEEALVNNELKDF